MPRKGNDYQTWVKMITGLYILLILQSGPAHGNKIADEIKRHTAGAMRPNPNALYPLLRLMEERGYVSGNWDNPETRNKRIYHISATGAQYIPDLQAKVKERLDESLKKLEILRDDLFGDTR